MSNAIVYDASDFKKFATALRREQPQLAKRMRSRLGKLGRAAAAKMRQNVPHQDSGAGKGVKFSEALSSGGAAIVIGGSHRPAQYAYAFGVGQAGRLGSYKHPVFGNWSQSPATIEPISDFVVSGWREVGTGLMIAADAAVQETIEELSFGTFEGDI